MTHVSNSVLETSGGSSKSVLPDSDSMVGIISSADCNLESNPESAQKSVSELVPESESIPESEPVPESEAARNRSRPGNRNLLRNRNQN